MSLFEAQVKSLRTLLEAHEIQPIARAASPLPDARAQAGLILQHEALCELGSTQNRSALSLVYTNATGGDAARLIGTWPIASGQTTADFGLVVILGGERLDAETFYRFTLRFPRLADHPGWMVKTDKTKIWIRVGGRDDGNVLEIAAASLIERIHAAFEAVESVELFFVVNESALIESLQPLAEQCQKQLRALKTGVWQQRGFDYESCELAGHCGSCSDKKTCASVRKIQAKVHLVRKEQAKEKEQ